MTGTLHIHQTLLDVAVQNCGSADALINLALLNDKSLTEDVPAGTSLLLPDVISTEVVKKLKPYGNVPVTYIDETIVGAEGIGYWFIEQNFVVQ